MDAPSDSAVIAGKYRLVRKLGQGGMGSVWLAEHLTLRSGVAIKLIHGDIVTSPDALNRFLREAQSAASLRSPHVVQILDHGVDNGTPYIAMELLDGESLADRLARLGRIEPAETARIMTHIARAIGRAHEAGIVHRDLKPDNVFLVRNDDEEIAKVLDFGIAKSTVPGSVEASVSSGTRTGAVLGSPHYMSPEQAEGAKTVDQRTDLWAMGVIAFECLLGRRPFEAETLGGLLLAICTRPILVPSHIGAVPPGFDAWFARACERDPSRRFASAREAAAEFKRVAEGGLISAGAHGAASIAPSSGASANAARQDAFGRSAPPIAGQSVAGLASTHLGRDKSGPVKARRGVALALAAVGVAVLGGAGVLWSHFKAEPTPAPKASAAAANAVVASAEVKGPEAPRVAEVAPPIVNPTPPASALSAAVLPAHHAPRLSAAGPVLAHGATRPSSSKTTPTSAPSHSEATAPVVNPEPRNSVNLGI